MPNITTNQAITYTNSAKQIIAIVTIWQHSRVFKIYNNIAFLSFSFQTDA